MLKYEIKNEKNIFEYNQKNKNIIYFSYKSIERKKNSYLKYKNKEQKIFRNYN